MQKHCHRPTICLARVVPLNNTMRTVAVLLLTLGSHVPVTRGYSCCEGGKCECSDIGSYSTIVCSSNNAPLPDCDLQPPHIEPYHLVVNFLIGHTITRDLFNASFVSKLDKLNLDGCNISTEENSLTHDNLAGLRELSATNTRDTLPRCEATLPAKVLRSVPFNLRSISLWTPVVQQNDPNFRNFFSEMTALETVFAPSTQLKSGVFLQSLPPTVRSVNFAHNAMKVELHHVQHLTSLEIFYVNGANMSITCESKTFLENFDLGSNLRLPDPCIKGGNSDPPGKDPPGKDPLEGASSYFGKIWVLGVGKLDRAEDNEPFKFYEE